MLKLPVTLSAALAALVLTAACGGSATPVAPTRPRAEFSQTDVRVGTGAEAVNGSRISVHYAGWLYEPSGPDGKGQLFDTSVGRAPLPVTVGAGNVIRGFDQGLAGMRVGGVRRLVIPPELAYGAAGNGPIPPNATLVFEIELLDVQ